MIEEGGNPEADLRAYGDGALSTVWTVARASNETRLACLSGGPAAEALRRASSLADLIATGVRAYFPQQRLLLGDCDVRDWLTQPWIEGSYSFPLPGQIMQLGDFWSRERGCLYFCGEHTDHAFVGFMEGALRSGLRAATQLLMRRHSESY